MNSDDDKCFCFLFFNFLECILFVGNCELLASAFVISGVNVRLDSVSPGHCSGDGIQKRQILGAAPSLARGLSEGDPTDMPVPCSKPRLSVDRWVKAGLLLMTFEPFATWLLSTHWAFGFFFTPLDVSHFPETPCVFAEIIPSNQNLLAIHACKASISSWIQLKRDRLWEAWLPLLGGSSLYSPSAVHTSRGRCFTVYTQCYLLM